MHTVGIPGLRKLCRVARWIKNALTPKAAILLYHRVAELPSDPQLLCVTPQHFAEHLEVLCRFGRPMRLQDLSQGVRTSDLPRQGVAVTFDDGYADNLHNAKPLLERHDAPATMFVTTGYINHEREFYWDELERLLLQPGLLPESLELVVNGKGYQWELDGAARYTEDEYRQHRHWSVLERNEPGPRHRLYRSLCRMLRPLPEAGRRKVLDDLMTWAGAQPMARSSHRTLSIGELSRLSEGGLVEVGAHTKTHPVLSALTPREQRAEIRESKTWLEGVLGHPVTSFSYPYGSINDYTAETVGFVREAGFTGACSNFSGVVRRGGDRFQLPRMLVRDWDGDEFARRLEFWLAT